MVKQRLIKITTLLLSAMLIAPTARPFTSMQAESFTARVVIDSFSALPVEIRHTSLQGISPLTQEAIIQGEAGLRPRVSPEFAARITPEDDPVIVPPDRDVIRVSLRYRVAYPDGTYSAVVEPPFVEGPDPLPFAFEINPADINDGSIEYQLKAERFTGDPRVVVKTTHFPVGAALDPANVWAIVGLESQAAQVFDSDGGRLTIPDGNPNDGLSAVDVPEGAFGTPSQVTFTEVPLNSPFAPQSASANGPLALYQFNSDLPFNGTLMLTLLYPDFTFPNGQDGIIDGTQISESVVAVAWWDGSRWRPLAARRNANLNTLSFRIANGMKLFAILPSAAASPDDARPSQKVITPNGDGANDTLIFTFFDAASNIQVEIFDITGRRIRSLSGVGTTTWDGRDDSGDIVESGVYIYQYSDGGKRISGAVAVAK